MTTPYGVAEDVPFTPSEELKINTEQIMKELQECMNRNVKEQVAEIMKIVEKDTENNKESSATPKNSASSGKKTPSATTSEIKKQRKAAEAKINEQRQRIEDMLKQLVD